MASERRSLSLLQEELRNQIQDQTGSIWLTNHPHPVILHFLSLEQTCLQRAQLENVCLIKTARSWRDTHQPSHAPVYHSATMTVYLLFEKLSWMHQASDQLKTEKERKPFFPLYNITTITIQNIFSFKIIKLQYQQL